MKATQEFGLIEQLTIRYADARRDLNGAVQALQTEIAAAQQAHMPHIRAEVERVAQIHETLSAAIAGQPHLFVKPRTVTFSGVKVGLQKGAGGMDWDDDEVLLARIKKMFKGDQGMLDALIITKEKPRKEGLETLDVDQLKRLGVEVVATGKRVVIKAADTEIDKVVRALLKHAAAEQQQTEEEAA